MHGRIILRLLLLSFLASQLLGCVAPRAAAGEWRTQCVNGRCVWVWVERSGEGRVASGVRAPSAPGNPQSAIRPAAAAGNPQSSSAYADAAANAVAPLRKELDSLRQDLDAATHEWGIAADALKGIRDVELLVDKERSERIAHDSELHVRINEQQQASKQSITAIVARLEAKLSGEGRAESGEPAPISPPATRHPPPATSSDSAWLWDLAGYGAAAAAAGAGVGIPAWAVVAGWRAIGYVAKRRRQKGSRSRDDTDAGAEEAPAPETFPGTTSTFGSARPLPTGSTSAPH